MLRRLEATRQHWPLARPFRISRGVRTGTEVVTVVLREGHAIGRGEALPYPRYGESVESVLAQIHSVKHPVEEGATREELQSLLPAGAARNAVDCAMWDLEASLGKVQWGAPLVPIVTAQTIGLDSPAAMRAASRSLRGAGLVKVKVDGGEPEACLRAVREELPATPLIVDANEAWTVGQLHAMQPILAELGVALLEQPLPVSSDDALAEVAAAVPICADESCHTRRDLARLRGRYSFINVKLDKTGGLTETFALVDEARALGFGVMVGCMISTSLAIAPAFRVAALAEFADLDGPLWLARDYEGGVRLSEGGLLTPPESGFWGEAMEGNR